ncbi:MAG: hypothetical protein ACYTFW_23585 [Planctomycetota bacterium]|jgi:methylthioribose-1-phosphate isomerase
MALTLTQLFEKRNDTILANKVAAAGWKEAKNILAQATPTATDLNWAAKMLNDDGSQATSKQLFRAVIVLLDDSAVTDAAIETAVGNAVLKLADLEV